MNLEVKLIINCTSAAKSMISKCFDCKQFRGNVCQQKIADLQSDRRTQEPPLIYCGIDMFGPFLVQYYDAMFTCMSSISVHIETDSIQTA